MGRAVCLRADGIHKAYGRTKVLRGVSLEVPAGAVVGVVGENGAGKSTLLRVLVGELTADAGTVERAGPLGYCPQHAVVNDRLTVEQHLRFFQVAYRLDDLRTAHRLLEVLSFERCRGRRVGTLSGGTRQKLNLTLALMHDPPILVLDEPYQGFDWETYQRFWELTAELREAGRSVLVVSHIAHDRDRFDTIGQLHEGVVEERPAG
ncbi:ATP-binding cassette domain-containing protein [Streptomyces sp. NPDC014892]|uniref:ATP-binding cassette domain-containing protein n=1 Tax=Streptomyces sp. NPDC014892 TaxID=3364930 RepID=UPI0037026CBE